MTLRAELPVQRKRTLYGRRSPVILHLQEPGRGSQADFLRFCAGIATATVRFALVGPHVGSQAALARQQFSVRYPINPFIALRSARYQMNLLSWRGAISPARQSSLR